MFHVGVDSTVCRSWWYRPPTGGRFFKRKEWQPTSRSNKIVDTCKKCRDDITQGIRDRNQATVAAPSNAEPSFSTGSTIAVDTGLPADVPIPAAASIASRAGTVCYAKMSSNIY